MDWFHSPGARRRRESAVLIVGTVYNIVVKLPWLVAIGVVTVLLIQGLVQRTTAIEPISVPKTLTEGGYTPEVAAQRLRDALARYVSDANSDMKSSEFALRGELPNIVVPTVGLSLETIMSSIRTFFDSTRRHIISGEFIVKENLLWLRLRVDGRERYSSPTGVRPEQPDELLDTAAASNILEAIQPYLVASWYYNKDRVKAFELANGIIARLPESDENVAWSYMLRGNIYSEGNQHEKAIEALKSAIRLNSRSAVIHVNFGAALGRQRKYEDAMMAFREAIRLDPKFANGHVGVGIVLQAQGKNEDAIAELREAIRLDPKHSGAYNNLGVALHALGRNEEAATAHSEAIKLDPKYARAHDGLGMVLGAQGKHEEAIAEYRESIRLDPNYSYAHNNLGVSLKNLGVSLNDKSKIEEAIAEFCEAIRLDPANTLARNNLGGALCNVPGAPGSPGENKPPARQ